MKWVLPRSSLMKTYGIAALSMFSVSKQPTIQSTSCLVQQDARRNTHNMVGIRNRNRIQNAPRVLAKWSLRVYCASRCRNTGRSLHIPEIIVFIRWKFHVTSIDHWANCVCNWAITYHAALFLYTISEGRARMRRTTISGSVARGLEKKGKANAFFFDPAICRTHLITEFAHWTYWANLISSH